MKWLCAALLIAASVANAQSAPACRPGTYYRTEYDLMTKRDDFDAVSMTNSPAEDLLPDQPSARERVQVSLVKYAPNGKPASYHVTVVFQGLDTVSIREGESLVLLIGNSRQALRTMGPPRTQTFADGATSAAIYNLDAQTIKSVAFAPSMVRLRIRGEQVDHDFRLSADALCAFARFYVEAVATP